MSGSAVWIDSTNAGDEGQETSTCELCSDRVGFHETSTGVALFAQFIRVTVAGDTIPTDFCSDCSDWLERAGKLIGEAN